MRDIKVTFTAELPDGGNRSLAAVPSKCTVSRAVCSEDLHHQQSTASIEFPYDPDLFRFLFTGGSLDASRPGKIKTAAIADGDETVFTGVPSSRMAWTDLGEPWPADRLSLSLSDGTDALGISAPREMGWINAGISEIVRDICAAAKVRFRAADWQNLPKTTLVIDEGKQLKGVLDEFLLQQGLSYYFGTDGYIRPFRLTLADAPDGELGEHDIVGSPSISQQDRDYTGVKVTYSALTRKKNEQVYFQGSGYKSDNTTAPTVVQPGVYYPFESDPRVEADEGQVYQTFETGYAETYRKYNGELDYRRSEKARLIYTENHRVMPEWDGGIEVDRTEFGFRRASVRLVNNGGEDASVYSIAVRADAWYADTEGTVTAGQDGAPYTVECEYVYDPATAERLARLLAKYFVAPCYKMTAQSEKRLAPGSLVTFSTGLSGFTKDALVSAAQYDYDKELWTYTLIGYGGAARLDISRAKSQSSNVPALSEIAAVKKQVSQLPGADTTPPSIPVVTSLTGDDYGNALLVFSPSADTGSGMSHYNVYRRREGASATLQIAGTVSHDIAAPQFLWEDATAYKNTKYWYRVTAVDKAGNESAPSALAEFTSTVRIIPRPPEDPSATASEQGIRVAWRPFQSSDAALHASYHEVELSRDGGDTWTAIGRSPERTDYWFDRATDGYPEKSDLAAWRVRIRAVSTYGNTSKYVECAVGTDGYRTWKIGELTAHARAAEKVVTVAWSADGAFYGTLRFDLYKDGEPLLSGASARSFRNYLDGFPEKSDLAGITYRVVARTEADTRELDGIKADTSGYLTYKITPPEATVTAGEDGLHVSWTGKNGGYYLYPVYDVLVGGETVAEGITALSLDVPFPEENRYPLREDVAATEVTVVARTDADTAQSEPATPDVSAFRGWVPPVPRLYCAASGRTVPLSWNSPDVWGFSGCDVQVARAYKVVDGGYVAVTDPAELEWYAPALGKNPYESLDNYRNGEPGGWLSVDGTSVAFTVPLWGQQKDEGGNVMGATDTMYAYRVRGVTVAYKSDWTEPFFAEARATGAFDVVKAWKLTDTGEKVRLDGALGANQIFVEELAALSANLGLITDGGLFGGKYNYWAVNDTPMPDGSTLWKGSFRVGDEDQYIKATPVLDGDGMPTGRIDLEFRAGQFTINATGTRIDGKSFEVYDDKGNLMFSVSPDDGARVSVDTGLLVSGDYSFYQTSFLDNIFIPMQFAHGGGIMSMYIDWGYEPGDGEFPYRFVVKRTSLVGRIKTETFATFPAYFMSLSFIRIGENRNTVRLFGLIHADSTDDSFSYGLVDIDLSTGAYSVAEMDEDTVEHTATIIQSDYSLFFNCDNVLFVVDRGGSYPNNVSGTAGLYTIYVLEQQGLTELLSAEAECPNAPPVVDGEFVYLHVPYVSGSVIWRINRFTLAKEAVRLPIYVSSSNAGFVGYFAMKPDGFYIADSNIRLFLSETRRGEGANYVVRCPANPDWQSVPDGGSPEGLPFTAVEAYKVDDYVPWIKGEQAVLASQFLNGMADDGKVWQMTSAQNYDEKIIRAEMRSLSLTLDGGKAFYGMSGKSAAQTEYKWEHQEAVFGGDEISDEYASIWDSIFMLLYNDSAVPLRGGFALNWAAHGDKQIDIWLQVHMKSYTEKTGKAVYGGGIGFVGLYKDEQSGKYRYYLDTGAYIEFNADGTLAAQTGPQGTPGRDGRDGKDGADGKDGKDGLDGKDGEPGRDGVDGKDGADGKDGKDGTLTADSAVDAEVAEDNYAVGVKSDGTVTKTLWSKVWAWIKGKIEAASMTFRAVKLVFDTVKDQDGAQTLMGGVMATNDGWRFAAGGTANNGFLEIATKDDGTEPIKVAQYTGDYATKVREAALLDGSGNTSFPGTLTAGGYQQTRLFVIDTTSLSESMFYPVTFDSSDLMLDCEIHSRNLGGAAAYNQNVLHFQLVSQGWSDTPFALNVLQYGVYDKKEICIGAVGIGLHNGMNAVWVRGGNQYRFVCNRTPVLRTSSHTKGDETFTVGATAAGTGSNTNVRIVFNTNRMKESDVYEVNGIALAYFSGPIGILPYRGSDNDNVNAALFGSGKPPHEMVDMDNDAYNELVKGAYIATGSYQETGGIIVSGDGIDAWAPPDRGIQRWWNEDESKPVAAIAGNGAYLGTAESSAYAQVREFRSWDYFTDFVSNVMRDIVYPYEIDDTSVVITDTDYFPSSNNILGAKKGEFRGLLGAEFKCFVNDYIPGISGYGRFIVETSIIKSENDGDIYGIQVAYAVTTASSRHSYKRCHVGEDGWTSWSSNDL